ARQPVSKLLPRVATVHRLEDAVAGPAESLPLNETLLLLPERGVNRVRIGGIDAHLVATRVLGFGENPLEGLSAVRRTKASALGVWAVGVAERGDEEPVRVRRVDVDHRDHLAVAQTEMRPC